MRETMTPPVGQQFPPLWLRGFGRLAGQAKLPILAASDIIMLDTVGIGPRD
jgi:hypothetical protein